jgi:anti-sigma-K factor RskA
LDPLQYQSKICKKANQELQVCYDEDRHIAALVKVAEEEVVDFAAAKTETRTTTKAASARNMQHVPSMNSHRNGPRNHHTLWRQGSLDNEEVLC